MINGFEPEVSPKYTEINRKNGLIFVCNAPIFVVGAIRVGRKLGIRGCFLAPMGHPWPVPRFIPGASHKKTTPYPKLARVLFYS